METFFIKALVYVLAEWLKCLPIEKIDGPLLSIFISLLSSTIFELGRYVILKIRSRMKTELSKKGGSGMEKIYACLIGDWVCLNDDPGCTIGENGKDLLTWYEEGADIFAPEERKPDTYYQLDYVHIRFKGRDYRINPIHIQVVEG